MASEGSKTEAGGNTLGVCEICRLTCRASQGGTVIPTNSNIMLMVSARMGHVDCMKTCLAAGADVNTVHVTGVTALVLALKGDDDACVRVLLEAGADVNQFIFLNRTALMLAVRDDHILSTDRLIAAGADVNKQDYRECTATMMAAEHGKDEHLEALFQAGADVNIQDHEGRTPLIWATTCRKYECVETLIEEEADLNKQNYEGNTALLFSVMYGLNHFLKLLIDAGADVNISDIHDDTPLYHALSQGSYNPDASIKSVQLLLLAGASVNIVNKGGLYCRSMVNQLRRFGASCSPDIESYLFAAGERLDKALSQDQTFVSLSHLCRDFIRKHLLKLDPHENLFVRVPKLGLPAALQEFLLFNVSLSDDV